MEFLIKEIEKKVKKLNKQIIFKNDKLNTNVYTSSNIFYNDLENFSKSFL